MKKVVELDGFLLEEVLLCSNLEVQITTVFKFLRREFFYFNKDISSIKRVRGSSWNLDILDVKIDLK